MMISGTKDLIPLTVCGQVGQVLGPASERTFFMENNPGNISSAALEKEAREECDIWSYSTDERGRIVSARCKEETLLFRSDEYAGPALYIQKNGQAREIILSKRGGSRYEGKLDGVLAELSYSAKESLDISVSLKNTGNGPFVPERVFLRLGIDTYMDEYPKWDNVLFPTLLRCEKTHFWGYFRKPSGARFAICSDGPVKSWKLCYNRVNENHIGHRIYTAELDLLNCFKQPERHPSDYSMLAPGEVLERTIRLFLCDSETDVKEFLFERTGLPFIEACAYTLEEGEELSVKAYTKDGCWITLSDDSRSLMGKRREGRRMGERFSFGSLSSPGVYTLEIEDWSGKIAEAKVYVRREWSWYLKKAREAALKKPQKAGTHAEGWYGFFSAFLARRYFPEEKKDLKLERDFYRALSLMFDRERAVPLTDPGRICNTSTAISLLTDAYIAGGKEEDLVFASRLGDYLMETQAEDGSYRAYSLSDGEGRALLVKEKGLHYTSVLYAAKSMLELSITEKKAAKENPKWAAPAEKHYLSVKRAVDELARCLDNINTEGEITFEDGMISCSVSQIAMFALLEKEPEEKKRYIAAAEYLHQKHLSLEQRQIPDCRMRGATLRFWEAQYDVLASDNMMNSPHGWTSWNTYGLWYLYLLTGERHYLVETMETLGTCMQMIDLKTGDLRWAFVSDPCVITGLWKEIPRARGKGMRVPAVLGETYVDMISGWWKSPKDAPVGDYLTMPLITEKGILPSDNRGGCCDNDVHEHFKALSEIALDKAYVIVCGEKAEGWNADVMWEDGKLLVRPREQVIKYLHVNSDRPVEITVFFSEKCVFSVSGGAGWFSPEGPADIRDVLY